MQLPELAGGQVRIGVALQLPEPYASTLSEARRSYFDPVAKIVPPHITVLAPTVVETENVKAVLRHLRNVASKQAPFSIHLRGTGTFRPVSDVVFIQVVQGIAECEQLESSVRSGPLDRELRFNYHPHVTIAHDVPPDQLDRAFVEYGDFDAQYIAESFRIDLLDEIGSATVLSNFKFTTSA